MLIYIWVLGWLGMYVVTPGELSNAVYKRPSFKVTLALLYKLVSNEALGQEKWFLENALYLFSSILIAMACFSSNLGENKAP